MRCYLILGMCGVFLVQYFVHIQWLRDLVVIMALLAFVGSTTKASPLPRWLGIFMMGTGIVLEISKGTAWSGTSAGLLSILPVMSLVILAPLLSVPLRLGGYFDSVALLLRNLTFHPRKLYAGISTTLFILSPILSLGSVRIIHEFLDDLKLPPPMSAKSYVVGFSTAVIWSPYFASVSLVLYYLNIPFRSYILYGLGMSILSLIIGNLLFAWWVRRHPLEREDGEETPLEPAHRKQLAKLVLLIVGLMSSCLILEHLTHWSMVVIVCLMSVLLPLVLALVKRDWKRAAPLLADYRDRTVPMMNNEIMLFLSAGLLGYAMQGTSAANGISSFLTGLAHQSFFLFAAALMAIVLVITYVGIHQIAAVGALAMQLNAQELGMSNLGLAMFLLLTWSLSTALSPFSGLNIMVSKFTGRSGVEAGLRANGLHLSLFALIGVFIISYII